MTYKLACGCVKAHTCDAIVRRGQVARGTLLRPCTAHGGPAADPVGIGQAGAGRTRYAAGRRVQVPKQVRTARDLIRRHMREEGHNMTALAAPWNVQPATVKTIMHHGRPLAVQHIEAAIEFLKLDEFDALELRLQAAIDAGWKLDALKRPLI